MNNLFEEWKNEIKEYCENYSLDFDKVCRLGKCYSSDTLYLQHIDKNAGKIGLLDETSAPVALIVRNTGNGLAFEQTENTTKYLK